MDLGDGIRRHPTQLYEILVLALMVVPLWRFARRTMALSLTPDPAGRLREGDAFKAFMVGYMALRVLVDFVKPYPRSSSGSERSSGRRS